MAVNCASTCGYCAEGLPRRSRSPLQKIPAVATLEVEVGATGDVADNACRDKDESCPGRAAHGQCDRYPM